MTPKGKVADSVRVVLAAVMVGIVGFGRGLATMSERWPTTLGTNLSERWRSRRTTKGVDTSARLTRIGSIVIHCYEFDQMIKFWSEALGYTPDRPLDGGWVVLRAPEGDAPNLSLQKRDVPRTTRSWIHLDLYARDQKREVERLVGLGARRYPWRYEPDADYVVLEDPDGNLFCVVQDD